eukprot:837086-Amphidinium_carterae.1
MRSFGDVDLHQECSMHLLKMVPNSLGNFARIRKKLGQVSLLVRRSVSFFFVRKILNNNDDDGKVGYCILWDWLDQIICVISLEDGHETR